MLRDNLAGLIVRAVGNRTAPHESHRTIDPNALKIHAPNGRNLH